MRDDNQENYRSEIITAFGIPKEMFETELSQFAVARLNLDLRIPHIDLMTNQTVCNKFGQDVDYYLHMKYAEYNHHTEVVIIADANRRNLQYTYFDVDKDKLKLMDRVRHTRVEFQQIVTNSGTIFLAYAPEINTLFVRTLFDVIRTPDNPDDKMDIEARLGL